LYCHMIGYVPIRYQEIGSQSKTTPARVQKTE
jgi:hypothetical protein